MENGWTQFGLRFLIWGLDFRLAWAALETKILGMPQVQLPLFADGTTAITPELAFARRDQQVSSTPTQRLASARVYDELM